MAGSILVLGMGNTLAGDDGVGIHVARAVAQWAAASGWRDVEVEETPESYFALLDYVGQYDRVIVVDAWRASGHAPGEVHCFDVESLSAGRCAMTSHGIGLASVVSLARQAVHNALPRVTVVAVTVDDNSMLLTEGLTPAVRVAVDRAAGVVADELSAGRGSPSRSRPNDLEPATGKPEREYCGVKE
ncbi:MAG: hydrogenase maturation protease [Phycisphaerae bacterium]|nr:hydrogenase maturation protease [Phycisphaerae bacterium]